MDEIKDFEDFYASKLQPSLSDLNVQSNNAQKWSIAGIAFLILAIFCFIINQKSVAILFIILIIISVYKYTKKKDLFVANYKETIINEIIKYLNPGTEYYPSKSIASKDYKRSGLFRQIYENYEGSDLLKGYYKNVQFYCSELEISYDSLQDAPLRSRQVLNGSLIIFKGLFFGAIVSSAFQGGTYIWPAGDEQIADSIMDENYRLLPLPKVYHIKTNNENFEKNFSVYTTSAFEASKIVDEEMMERILKFKAQINRNIRLSVVGGIFYVAISIDEDLLEPSISYPDKKENIKEYFFSVLLILSVINQLNIQKLL